jgi:hypothetical protein
MPSLVVGDLAEQQVEGGRDHHAEAGSGHDVHGDDLPRVQGGAVVPGLPGEQQEAHRVQQCADGQHVAAELRDELVRGGARAEADADGEGGRGQARVHRGPAEALLQEERPAEEEAA